VQVDEDDGDVLAARLAASDQSFTRSVMGEAAEKEKGEEQGLGREVTSG
jgi:hypothetical protein